MEGGADDLCIVLVEVISLVDTPSRVGDSVVEVVLGGRGNGGRVFIVGIHLVVILCLPCEDRSVFADGVNLDMR